MISTIVAILTGTSFSAQLVDEIGKHHFNHLEHFFNHVEHYFNRRALAITDLIYMSIKSLNRH